MRIPVTAEDGQRIEIPADETRVDSPEGHDHEQLVLDKVLGQIGITLRLTTDEVARFFARQCIALLNLPQSTTFTYECSQPCDLVIELRFGHAVAKEIFINLYHVFCGDSGDRPLLTLLRHAGSELLGRLIDAGFEIIDGSCINGDFATDGYQDYSFYGDVHALTPGPQQAQHPCAVAGPD